MFLSRHVQRDIAGYTYTYTNKYTNISVASFNISSDVEEADEHVRGLTPMTNSLET